MTAVFIMDDLCGNVTKTWSNEASTTLMFSFHECGSVMGLDWPQIYKCSHFSVTKQTLKLFL